MVTVHPCGCRTNTGIGPLARLDFCPLHGAAKDLLSACQAALAYDQSILGRAARGEVDLLADGGGVATGDDLDRLYAAMVGAARAAIAKATGGQPC